MPDIPYRLRPLIGYAMWHLQRGESRDQVLELFAKNRRYGGLPAVDWNAALDQAALNVAATDRLGFMRPEMPIGRAFAEPRDVVVEIPLPEPGAPAAPPPLPPLPPGPVGIRVRFPVPLPAGGPAEASITVNVPPGLPLSVIKDAIEDAIRRVFERSYLLRQRAGEVPEYDIYQVIEGGLERPTVDLTR